MAAPQSVHTKHSMNYGSTKFRWKKTKHKSHVGNLIVIFLSEDTHTEGRNKMELMVV